VHRTGSLYSLVHISELHIEVATEMTSLVPANLELDHFAVAAAFWFHVIVELPVVIQQAFFIVF